MSGNEDHEVDSRVRVCGLLEIDPVAQVLPEFLPSIQLIPSHVPDVLRAFHIPVVVELFRCIVGKKIWEIMNVIGFDAAELGLPLPGKSADPEQAIPQDGEDHLGDLGRTMHGNHLKGRLRIESALATADSVLTRTSTTRPSSAAART
jgi:hypothetical protein